MSSIQNVLNSLQPYVIGIRYIEGSPVVDVVLKDGWSVIDDPRINRVKGDESLNYHMILAKDQTIGLDDLLSYVDKVIKANLDREKKHDLLRAKVDELKEVFKKNSLEKLQRLKFSFIDVDEFNTSLDDIDIDEINDYGESYEEPTEEDIPESIDSMEPNNEMVNLTPDEQEMIEEEKRAERNRKLLESKKKNQNKSYSYSKKIELPPKRKLEQPITSVECNCGPYEACNKCMDTKQW